MIGLFGFLAIWAAGAWPTWPKAVVRVLLGLWWALLVLVTAPGIGAPGLVAWVGGEFRALVLLGPVAVAVAGYRALLARLRRRAAPATAAVQTAGPFAPDEVARYSRHILLHDIGGPGQQRLKAAKVLVVGAGGLGSPALMYLAASGVGVIGIIDPDRVEASNLQRQIIHGTDRLGMPKVFSAEQTIRALNPFVEPRPFHRRLDGENAAALIADYDLVLDGTDNFDTRYLVNRVCAELGKPLIAAALTQWEGQLSLYDPARGGPCYECLFPVRPAPGLVPTCAEAGVAAPLPGILGAMMAAEAVKHLTGAGTGLRGRLLLHDALHVETRVIATRPRADCPVCGGSPV